MEIQLQPLSGRGSDRAYFRLRWAQTNSAILVHYQTSRIENTYFADIAIFLFENGIPVPRILRHQASDGLILMEDLHDTDLWSLRDSSWETRRNLYRETLVAANQLHSVPLEQIRSRQVNLMEPFGSALYRWERDYFLTNFVKNVCKIDISPQFEKQLENELAGIAERLECHERCLVHRDLQSQNVMICGGKPFFIDFQGMRVGSRFYDLGSLLCDPYVVFSKSERMELMSFYCRHSDPGLDWDIFQTAFWDASAQRLMQALGAYGFLGLIRGLSGYLSHVPAGLENLSIAAANADALPCLLELCDECKNVFRDSYSQLNAAAVEFDRSDLNK